MTRRDDLPEAAGPARPDPRLRSSKLLVLFSIAVPTLLILVIMSGIIESARPINSFPFVDIQFRTPALLVANTPTGGDMGAHVLLPQYLRDTLLPSGRILGWSNDWYAGFPVLYFYFPLPALTTVLLDLLLPYGVAFKITTILGLLALPTALYFFIRSLGFARLVAGLATTVASGYVFMESFSIFGGNVKSTLAGEFSFGWSFALSLVYLGLVVRDTRSGRGFTPRAALVLAATALTHIVTTMVVVVVSLVLFTRRGGARTVVQSWLLGFAVSAFWALPLAIRVFQGMTADMNWSPVRGLLGDTFSPGVIATPLPNEFIPVLALGIVGMFWTLLRRDDVTVLLAMTLLPAIGYWVLQLEGVTLTKVYNGRLLPYWYLGVFIFAGLAVGLMVRAGVRYLPDRTRNLSFAGSVIIVLALNVTIAGVHDLPGWVRWNFTGYEGKDNYAQYDDLLSTLASFPEGRVMWEANSDLGRYGTPMALMLVPYWTETQASMEGLFFESSLSTPFHFLNASEVSEKPSNPVRGLTYRPLDFERAIPHLAVFGVDYYVAWTDAAKEAAAAAGLPKIVDVEPWSVFDLPDSPLVEIADRQPLNYVGDEPFVEAALNWYDDIEGLDQWMVVDGPEDWPQIADFEGPFDGGARFDTRGAQVTAVDISDHRISFRTDAVGVPHLIKVSYFPAWSATGAEGPYRAAPSLMIVVPTEESVVIEFKNGVPENIGLALTAISLVGLLWWEVRRRNPPLAPGSGRAVRRQELQ